MAGCKAREVVGDSKGWASVTWRDEHYSPSLNLPSGASLRLDWKAEPSGFAIQGKAKIDHFQSYLRDFWSQAQKLHAAGVKPEEAAKLIDLRSHAPDYPTLTTVGVLDHGLYRAYDLMDGKVR